MPAFRKEFAGDQNVQDLPEQLLRGQLVRQVDRARKESDVSCDKVLCIGEECPGERVKAMCRRRIGDERFSQVPCPCLLFNILYAASQSLQVRR
jgi:hypothetical protein